jgi:hypothetical protein
MRSTGLPIPWRAIAVRLCQPKSGRVKDFYSRT